MNKNRRAKRAKAKHFVKSLKFLGVNAAGLKPKMVTFKKVVDETKPAVSFVQESKINEEGKLTFDNYEIFEMARVAKEGEA